MTYRQSRRVENLQTADPLTCNHDLGMAIAEFDLTNRPAKRRQAAENYRRAIPGASRRPAGRQITASPDLNRGCRGIEVGFEHRFRLHHARLMSAMAGGATDRLWSVARNLFEAVQA